MENLSGFRTVSTSHGLGNHVRMSIEDVFGHFRWCWKKIVGGVYRGVRQTRIGLLAGAVGVGVGESFGLASLVPRRLHVLNHHVGVRARS